MIGKGFEITEDAFLLKIPRSNVFEHPKYNAASGENDIALIRIPPGSGKISLHCQYFHPQN
jgi:hypothetical protein